MDSTDESLQSLQPLPVHSVGFRNESLVYTLSDGTQDAVTADEVLFALDLTPSARGFIVCCLREGVDTQCNLLLLTTDALPAELQPIISQLPRHLCRKDGSQVHIIVSTHSGTGLAPTFWRTVLRPLLHLVCDMFGARPPDEALMTDGVRAVRDFGVRLRGGRGEQTVILLSGDGGVADLLDGYGVEEADTKPTIALLPLGTGNALFHSLHRLSPDDDGSAGSSPLAKGLRTLFLGEAAGLPIFRASFSPGSRLATSSDDDDDDDESKPVSYIHGAIVASFAFHASLIHESDTRQYRLHGAQRFSLVAENLLQQPHAYRAEVTTDGETLPHDEHGYLVIAMTSNLERTFTISPASRPLDGRLHLVRLGDLAADRVVQVMQRAYAGGSHVGLAWDDGEAVLYREVADVRVRLWDESERWRKVCVDGTIVLVPRGGEVRVWGLGVRP
ncbi:Diacylglycerol kinase, catalytic domain protein [Ophiocordyceps camponoti-floridani]|uniref:Diacylglycerol kinase, catalytic domain protein n=1 Tax=Ophiocordyceps camponoti-floridani TaxID=2030778 RepID=A0A8H4Q640_9HYPO|nr:Diacylglycerol kinase, catalytic domain protein [Ophiocordyceps camponoti-floridani]